MKVYVDELPIDCASCFCIDNELPFCCLTNEYVMDECDMFKERCPNCPLQSLIDYTKQVRKEVIEEVLQTIDNEFNCLGWIEDIKFTEFKEKLLKKLQGETK